jgi:hypothetical protein
MLREESRHPGARRMPRYTIQPGAPAPNVPVPVELPYWTDQPDKLTGPELRLNSSTKSF